MSMDSLHLAATAVAVDNDDPATLERIRVLLDAEDTKHHTRLTGPTALAGAALWYASRGIPVFPLRPRLKVPLTGHGFKDATTDPVQIAEWWKRCLQANIGMPTGTVADVIDVDGPAGIVAISPYIEEIRARAIGIVSTPRPGGMHYFVPPQVRKNSAGKVLAHIDTRGAGGYVVLPPSVTDDHGTGRRYTWVRPLVTT